MNINNLDVSREANEILVKYQELLLKWNKKINLVSESSEADIWYRHIMDSLQLLSYVDFSDSILDIGSGAGFPGIILSICGVKNIALIECDERKSVFLRQAAMLSPNNVSVVNKRVDERFFSCCDILTCRGFAHLAKILAKTKGVKIGKKMLLLKGETYKEEIEEARKLWLFNVVIHDSITSSRGKVLEIFDILEK